ncbi:protein kinase domain-containing protein [Micromonospora rubida]|uniref:protein kinase domain-containing protein n=1 Tax=Micromonospora rubida TaxID=2697657 RepID=UPI0038B2DFF9
MFDTPQRSIAGRYRLVSPLGQGGMGRVWLARDETLRRDVAIKELVPPPGLTDDERREMRERSMREARAIARLDQTNVVRIFDVLHADGEPWIVMEYVPSRSLQAVLTENGPLAPAQVARIGLALLAALRAAHRAELLHRDVKPANVLLANDGRVVLTDFGLATAPDDPSVTRTGIVLGSPSYLAPERLTDCVPGPAADLWSLGATLYAAVEGKSPYARSSAIATLTAIATDPPTPPQRAGALTPALEGLLRKDPSLRIDAEEAERLLRQAIPEQPSRAHTHSQASARPAATGTTAADTTAAGTTAADTTAAAATAAGTTAAAATAAGTTAATTQEEPARKPSATTAPPDEPTQTPITATSATAATRRKRWLIAAVVAVGLVGVIAAQPLFSNALADEAKPDPVLGTTASPAPAPMAGWHYHTQDPGFSIPVPDGSQQLRDGTRVEFHELDSRRVLAIDALGAPRADLLADARATEAADHKTGRYPDYESVHLRKVNYRARAVDREWTYVGAGGRRMHTLSRTFVAENGQAYAIEWTTPDDAWEAGQDALSLIMGSFRALQAQAAPGGASTSAKPSRSASPSPRASVTPLTSPKPAKSGTLAKPRFTNQRIVNNGSGTCIDVPDSNPNTTAKIQAWECHGAAGEKFTLAADRTLRVIGKCLEITDPSNGPHLRIATCTGSAKQRFDLNSAGDLVTLGTVPAKCVDLPGGDSTNGAWLNIWDCNGRENQKWHIG